MKGLSCFLTFLIVMGGCSTTSKDILPPHASTLPPEYNISSDKDKASVDLLLQNLILPDTGESTHWWVAYKRARLWAEEKPELSCPLFTKLSRDQRFPIHRLAFLRSFEVCDKVQGRPGEKSPELVAENFDPWFENLILEVQLQRAQRLGDKKALLFASWEKSKLNLPRDQKVEHTLKALRLAKKLKLKKEKAKLLARFYRLAPRHQPRPRRRDYFKVAYDFRRVREFDKARKYYRKIIFHKKTMGDDKVRAYKGLAATYKVENNKAKYLKALGELGRYTTKLLGRAKNKKWAARLFKSTHLSLARAQWTEGQVTNDKKRGAILASMRSTGFAAA